MAKFITFLLLIILTLQNNSAAQPAATVATYEELIHEVRAAFARGEERAAEAVERERVQTNWEVGKLIQEHILLHKERAEYGKEVMQRLADDLGISLTEIRYMVQFARAYPIRPHAGELSWSEYRDLLSVNDEEERNKLADQVAQNKWPREILRNEIKKLKAKDPEAVNPDLNEELLTPIQGKPNTYRIVTAEKGKWQGKPVIDLGFSNSYRPDKLPFKEGDIVQVKGNKLGRTKDLTEADLYTYRAYVLEITDGDTLIVLIGLGFEIFSKQRVRLRGIDAPEIMTRDGQAAKEFVERELKNTREVIVTSSKSDKYDRYLVDLFYESRGKEKFLNNELLTHHLAVRAE